MPLGEYRDENNANLGDTILLETAIYNADNLPYSESDLLSVEFRIRKPDATTVTQLGEITPTGTGKLIYGGTTLAGPYVAIAKFSLSNGEIKSQTVDFDVTDPFDATLTPTQQIVDAVWLKLEDCFDSEEGGPWLRDVTKRFFGKRKIPALIDEALTLINLAPPMTSAVLADFTFVGPGGLIDPDQSILVEAVFISVIRHLMRSYVEQPLPTGATVVYEDRRDYLQRWQVIYTMEVEYFNRILALWKRQFLNLGKSSLLLGSKAGRLTPYPLRTRYVGRGGY